MKTNRPLFGYMKGTMVIVGDIVSPDPEPWNSEQGTVDHDENSILVCESAKETENNDEPK